MKIVNIDKKKKVAVVELSILELLMLELWRIRCDQVVDLTKEKMCPRGVLWFFGIETKDVCAGLGEKIQKLIVELEPRFKKIMKKKKEIIPYVG